MDDARTERADELARQIQELVGDDYCVIGLADNGAYAVSIDAGGFPPAVVPVSVARLVLEMLISSQEEAMRGALDNCVKWMRVRRDGE